MGMWRVVLGSHAARFMGAGTGLVVLLAVVPPVAAVDAGAIAGSQKWSAGLVTAPIGSHVSLRYSVRAKRVASVSVQRLSKSGWRQRKTLHARSESKVLVRLPVTSHNRTWRLSASTKSGRTLKASAPVTVMPSTEALATAARSSSRKSGRTPTPTPSPTQTPPPTGNSGDWLSGVAGNGAVDGTFGTWRGTPVEIGGTWNDSQEAQVEQWTLLPGFEWGLWQDSLDVAIGAIYQGQAETWSAAARGAYDQRWTKSLKKMKNLWGTRPGTMYIRFAHEFNGDWVPWKVTGGQVTDFVAAWKRFRALQQSIFPASKLVFCPNDGSSTSLNLDWREAFPGSAYVDVVSVDSYNQWPFVSTAAEFEAKTMATDSYGAPVGMERHRRFAQSQGLPFAVSEWSSNSSMGDSAVYVAKFHDWVAQHAGTGAGQVLYEILFNVGSYNSGVFQMYPSTHMQKSASQYVKDF